MNRHTNSQLLLKTILIVIAAILTAASADALAVVVQQKTFASGQQAVDAFVKALKEDNLKELAAIFGPDSEDLIQSGDPAADKQRHELFLFAYEQQHRLETAGDKIHLVIGPNEWPFPIPLVKQDKQWIFDTAAGAEEIINRRIGRNELLTIQGLLAIVDAQREYAMKDRDGDGLLEYAQKFISDPNTANGLYWETQPGEVPSPLGLYAARAKKDDAPDAKPVPYYGYCYQILTAQGASASGGAFDYFVKDSLVGGFAVLAYPANYGASGIMTFMVNHDGAVYQKDLGEKTEEAVSAITLFDPDKTWEQAQK